MKETLPTIHGQVLLMTSLLYPSFLLALRLCPCTPSLINLFGSRTVRLEFRDTYALPLLCCLSFLDFAPLYTSVMTRNRNPFHCSSLPPPTFEARNRIWFQTYEISTLDHVALKQSVAYVATPLKPNSVSLLSLYVHTPF